MMTSIGQKAAWIGLMIVLLCIGLLNILGRDWLTLVPIAVLNIVAVAYVEIAKKK
jgi:hypothetical protein